MNIAYLCLGGNIEKRETYLIKAIESINAEIGIITGQSAVYETEAWGVENQLPYLNMCIKVITNMDELSLLKACLRIESKNGRIRNPANQYSSRTIDIDILCFNQSVFNQKELIIPHPRLHLRRFVLKPLSEIAGDYIHPVINKFISELNELCKDQLQVKLYKKTLH